MTVPHALDIVTAGRLLRQREISSRELTRACLAQIEALNPSLNAFITVTRDEALRAAAEADRELAAGLDRGPLHGIPLSLKDLVDQRGWPTTAASRVPDGTPAARDADLVAALRDAGAVFVGKTNLHEFALGTTSDESAFGPVRHPLDTSRSAGGSSGGSAVSVSAGMALASIGTDTGGSIRIPSSVCGLVGLKPGIGEVPMRGVVPLSATFDVAGPITRTVRDAAIVHAAVMRTAPLSGEARAPGGMRIGVVRGYFTERLEPAVRDAFEQACARLARAGVALDDVTIPHAAVCPAIYLGVLFPEAAAYHAATLESAPDRYTPGVRARFEAARYVLGEDYVRAQAGRAVIRDAVTGLLDGRAALLAPTLPIVAPVLGAATVPIDGSPEPIRNIMLRLTQPFNISGHPAITIPCGSDADGLPCGVQLVGRHGATFDLLGVALALEDQIRGGTG